MTLREHRRREATENYEESNSTRPTTPRKLVAVVTLTRHGSRSPDAIIAKVSCKPLLNPDNEKISVAFLERFHTGAGELTDFGVSQMHVVGRFVRDRYQYFVDMHDYASHTKDFDFVAREGSRQQRSMMAIVQAMFPPGTVVPIAVMEREFDAVLGGPAPPCGAITARMIVDWQNTKGRALVRKRYETAVKPFEELCNVSLADNPVNAAPGGPNPHSWIGDVSDLLDSMRENDQYAPIAHKITPEQYRALTDLAFELEQRSHYDDPSGDVMFTGDFMEQLLTSFELMRANGNKRPGHAPKLRMFACSRELQYGLEHLMGYFDRVRLPGEPMGRVRPGTTIIWEYWNDSTVDTYLFQPGTEEGVVELERAASLSTLRSAYAAAITKTGDWRRICGVKGEFPPPGGVAASGYTSLFSTSVGWLAIAVVGVAAYIMGFRRSQRGGLGWCFGLIGGRRSEYAVLG